MVLKQAFLAHLRCRLAGHVGGHRQLHCTLQHLLQAPGIPAEQHGGAAVLLHGRTQRHQVGALGVAARDQHHPAVDTADGCQRGADVGALGIVVPVHAVALRHRLHAVRQPLELGQRGHHRPLLQTSGRAQCQGCQCIADIVPAGHADGGHRHHGPLALRQQRLALVPEDPEFGCLRRRLQGVGDAGLLRVDQRGDQGIVAVDDLHAGTAVNRLLGTAVGVQVRVAIHVVGTDVEHHRHVGMERKGGLAT